MRAPIKAPPPTPVPHVPELQQGDRLTREEFERRFDAMAQLKKAELIEGVVYMPSPVSADGHGEPHFNLNGWLFFYQVHTPGVVGGDNSSLRLDLDNEPQPDGYLRLVPECGGRARVVDRFLEGSPELIVEIAATSASYDLHDKLNAYRRSGVQEYVVWRVWDEAVDWFVHRQGRYDRLIPGDDGVYRSLVLPGLWLDAAAVVRQDFLRVLHVLQQGLASPEHAALVTELERALGRKRTE